MSEFKHKLNNGSVFKNNKKTIPTHPDFVGSGNFEGREGYINVWLTGKETPYMRLTFTFKDTLQEITSDSREVANDNREVVNDNREEVKAPVPVEPKYVYVMKPNAKTPT